MADLADHLIWYADGRFAKHPYFEFIVHNMIMRNWTLEQSTYIVQQQLCEKHLSWEKLQKVAEKIVNFCACLHGTDQCWAQRQKELRILIQFKINEGKFVFFLYTVSCTEYHFKPLRRFLEMYVFEITNSEVDFFIALKGTHFLFLACCGRKSTIVQFIFYFCLHCSWCCAVLRP